MGKRNNKILITGGSGALGSNIRKLIKCDAPDSRELDITNLKKCVKAVKKYNPDVIIHYPITYYGLTKLAGEVIINQYPDTLIVRTAFKRDGPWPHKKAFIDQWVSHEFVSDIAPDIIRASLMFELVGIIHIAGKKKRIFDLAKKVSPDIEPMSIKEIGRPLSQYTYLDSSKWKKISSKLNRVKK
jgi:hypothetical protein